MAALLCRIGLHKYAWTDFEWAEIMPFKEDGKQYCWTCLRHRKKCTRCDKTVDVITSTLDEDTPND